MMVSYVAVELKTQNSLIYIISLERDSVPLSIIKVHCITSFFMSSLAQTQTRLAYRFLKESYAELAFKATLPTLCAFTSQS